MITDKLPTIQQAHKLYDQYVKLLEPKYKGKYVAVSFDGKTILGADLMRVTEKAGRKFGPNNIVFKVGELVVGRIR